MIPPNVILIWPGTVATIPAGWERVTDLDNRYPKATADGVDPDVTGGSTTHTHTSPNHTHTMISHNHTGYTDNAHNSDESQCDNSQNNQETRDNHHHNFNISGVSGGSLVDAVTYASTASDPPFYSVIYIKSTTYRAIPDDAILLFSKTTIPANFLECKGQIVNEGEEDEFTMIDLRNKYLKGADTGANAGAVGGTLNHEHSINHTHSAVTHSHSGNTDGASETANSNDSTTRPSNRPHTHGFSLNANGAEASSGYTGNAGSADTVEPAYKKLVAIQNTSGGLATPRKGMIGMWLGALEDIPVGWVLCDGNNNTPDMRDKHLKIASTTAEIGNTGGNNTHTHGASNSHTHTASGTHTHTGGNTNTAYSDSQGSYGAFGLSRNHYHQISSVSSNTSSWNNATTSADSSNGEPPFRTVAFIQWVYTLTGGAALLAAFI